MLQQFIVNFIFCESVVYVSAGVGGAALGRLGSLAVLPLGRVLCHFNNNDYLANYVEKKWIPSLSMYVCQLPR